MSLLQDEYGNWIQTEQEYQQNGTPLSVTCFDDKDAVPVNFTGVVFFQKTNEFTSYLLGVPAVVRSGAVDNEVSNNYLFETDVGLTPHTPDFIKFDDNAYSDVTTIVVATFPLSGISFGLYLSKLVENDEIYIESVIDSEGTNCKYKITACVVSEDAQSYALSVTHESSNGNLFVDDEPIKVVLIFK